MKVKLSLQSKILVFILIPVVILFMLVGVFVGVRNKNLAIANAHHLTEVSCQKQASKIEALLNSYLGGVSAIASSLSGDNVSLDENLRIISKKIAGANRSTNYTQAWVLFKTDFYNPEQMSSQGWVLLESGTSGTVNENYSIPGFDNLYLPITKTSNQEISDILINEGKSCFIISVPIVHLGQIKGYAGVTVQTSVFTSIVLEAKEFTGSFFTVVTNSSKFIIHENPSFIGHTFVENFPEEPSLVEAQYKISNGEEFHLTTKLNGNEFYSAFYPIVLNGNIKPWSAEVTVPMEEILAPTLRSIRNSILVALLGIFILIYVIYRIAHYITKPVRLTTETLKLLSQGSTRKIKYFQINTNDELQEMNNSLNLVIEGLKKTETFALDIGKGNLESEYSLLSNDDHLGEALMIMRDSLKKNNEIEAARKLEEEHRNWATEGIAKFGEILRQDMNNLNKLGYNIMSNLIEYLKVNQGALFVLNDDNDDDPFFFLVTAIAYGRDKFLKKEIRVGEGLVGRCIFEKKTIYLTDIPDDYIKITSGLGTANPNCVLIVPCTLNDTVYGIIELAAFTALKPYEIEFIEKLGESIASTISSVRISEKTTKLLRASQGQSEELAAQEEELRQNLEEMETTQEDLKRQMAENAEIRENLAKETALLDALMDNSLDLIYFKDRECRFIRVTKSMLKLFNMQTYDQLIGKSDFDFAVKEEAQKYYEDEQKIMRTGIPVINQVQRETRHDGSIQFTVTSKYPLVDSSGNIIGTFGLTKDISDTKRIEEEAKMQAKALLQQNEVNLKIQEKLSKETALLESLMNTLHDLIYFKDKESRFIRVTRSMLKLLNVKSFSELEGKSDFDFAVKEEAQKYYDDEQKIIKTGVPIIDQIQAETRKDGSIEYTSTSKYPLIDTDGNTIGTFGYTKDITEFIKLEQKAIETGNEIKSILNALSLTAVTITYNSDGNIIDVNDNYLKLTGIKKDKIIGKSYLDDIGLGAVKAAELKKKWSKILEGEAIKELVQYTVNKKVVWFDEIYSPIINNDNKVVKILKIGIDVTEFKKQ